MSVTVEYDGMDPSHPIITITAECEEDSRDCLHASPEEGHIILDCVEGIGSCSIYVTPDAAAEFARQLLKLAEQVGQAQ